MTISANWNYPTCVKFGAGRIRELPAHVRAVGMKSPLLVTDTALAGLPITRNALKLLQDSGLAAAMFSDVRANPTDKNLDAGVAAYQAGRHDGVVAFGGGSALDLGKLIAFMAGQTRPVWDFEDIGDWWTRADAKCIAPIIAVPTTAGTGSEVGRAGVLTNAAAHVKKIIFHPKMMPEIAICDPELTVGMPPSVTAGTGLDAFAHCLEAYCSPYFHPLADGIAVEGMRLVKEHLPRAYKVPTDIEARQSVMAAAAMGATAFQKGLGAIHALSHPIGALYDKHHGMTNAVLMPGVLEVNRPAIEARLSRLAAYLNLAGGFDGFLKFVRELRRDLGVPETLLDFGVPRDGFDTIRDMSLVDPAGGGNPIPLTRELVTQMLERAYVGG